MSEFVKTIIATFRENGQYFVGSFADGKETNRAGPFSDQATADKFGKRWAQRVRRQLEISGILDDPR